MGVTAEAQSAEMLPRSAQSSAKYGAFAIAAVIIGLAIRLALAAYTVGTNDTLTWRRFAMVVQEIGLIDAYRLDPLLNHPPVFVLWAWLCGLITHARPGVSGVADEQAFGFLLKLPAIAADAVACGLLWRIGCRSGGARLGAMLCALLALSPINILISGFHGNTDNVYACLALAAFDAIASKRRMLIAGLLLGAAINVKLIPVLLIPAMLASCRRWAECFRVIAGLAIMSIPFLIVAYVIPSVVIDKMLLYASNVDRWGVTHLLTLATGAPASADGGPGIANWYFKTGGRWIMLGGIVLSAAWCGWRRIGPLATAAMAAAVFLLLAPGFGIQYLVLPGVLLLGASPRAGAWFAWFGGLFVGATYYSFLNGGPARLSQFYGLIPHAAAGVGLACYAILLIFAVTTATRLSRAATPLPALEPST